MKIGIFDSGLGGLWSAKSIIKNLPEYSYVYLGDTKRLPYGNRGANTVYEFFCEALRFFYEKGNCKIVVVACNTVSAEAVERAKKEFLPKYFPNRKIIGVVGSIARDASKYKRVGIIATLGTVASGTYPKRILEISPETKIFQNPAPLLVPIIEAGENELVDTVLPRYLKPLVSKKIEVLVLGCTHYAIIKNNIKKMLPKGIKIISQDTTLWRRVKDHLDSNPETKNELDKNHGRIFYVTEKTPHFQKLAKKWFPGSTLHEVNIK